jgi:c-di-GMP-binding flagellar brake protein YcgR
MRFIDLDEEDRDKIIAYTFQVQRDAIRKKKKGQQWEIAEKVPED